MALDKSDPFHGLPRRSLFAAKATVAPQPVVTRSDEPVVVSQRETVVPQLNALVDHARKRGEVKGKSFNVRLQPALESRVVAWATENQADSIPEAIRQLIDKALPDEPSQGSGS